MDMSTTELGIICTFFALMSLIRNHVKPKNADDVENLRKLVRSEIAKLDVETRRILRDEIERKV